MAALNLKTSTFFVSSIKNEIIFHNISLIFDNYIRISFVNLIEQRNQLNMNEKCCQLSCLEDISLRV